LSNGTRDSVQAATLDDFPDALITLSPDGQVLTWNVGAETVFGYSAAEAVGRQLDDLGEHVEVLVPERFRAPHPAHRGSYFDDPHARPMGAGLDLFGLRRDGSEFPAEISLSPMQAEEGVYVTAAVRDVTDRKRLEETRRKAEEELARRAIEASRLKSEFLANMSHEVRTPLNAIIGFAELLHDGKLGRVAPQHQEFLGDILTSARHLLQLINDVLDLAKVEAGRMEFHPELLDVPQIVAETRDILRTLAAKKGITLVSDVAPEVRTLLLDPAKLKQVLYNYLSNALKFTPEGGRVALRVLPEGPDHARIEVEDNGIGIRDEDLPRLFVEFQQLDSSLSKRYPGTGLGLALTRRMVEAQGGRVEVRSTHGKGSVFVAILPRVSPASREGEG
jgi:protein-histidine pros-kinase